MNQYTAIDEYGAVWAQLSGTSSKQVLLNVPQGCTLIDGPPGGDWWDGVRWRTKPERPSRHHTWDWEAHAWQDVRTPERVAADAQDELDAAWAQVRSQRDLLLDATDWRVVHAMEIGEQLSSAWQIYRQALRDLTQQQDPNNITWPVAPAERD